MLGVYLPEDMKAIDEFAIVKLGVPSDVLMETAARALCDEVRLAAKTRPGEIFFFCGTGNNGGDGIAAARFLRADGYEVRCLLLGDEEKLSPDAKEMTARLRACGGDLEQFDGSGAPAIIVDCMFGFSFRGALGGEYLDAAKWINASGAYVIACDLPSGVDPKTGAVETDAVMADVTLTMTGYKQGLVLAPGSEYAGRVQVAPIGIPEEAMIRRPVASITNRDLAKECFPRRRRNSHKGNYGKVLLLCGSVGYTGAAAMAAKACLRAGSGLVFLGVPEAVYPILAAKLDEAIVFPLPDENGMISEKALPGIFSRLADMDACLIGPGLGRSIATERVVHGVIRHATCPVVLDADGINALSGNMNVLHSVSTPLVLTPHDGEIARLGCRLSAEGRLEEAKCFAAEHKVNLLLKGYRTIVTDGEQTFVNTTGNPGMAVGGSGDVLSGILVSLLGRGIEPMRAAACAAWLHGAAGDRAAERLGEASMLPTDLCDALCEIIRELE
ncbi:MAG: NAD(P)H-hydrate dehydratase [Ruminococcaceae bacterium]|nr:NAD(P)H-hydrate dehydratase [Oscillospiraceae bacterium]